MEKDEGSARRSDKNSVEQKQTTISKSIAFLVHILYRNIILSKFLILFT